MEVVGESSFDLDNFPFFLSQNSKHVELSPPGREVYPEFERHRKQTTNSQH